MATWWIDIRSYNFIVLFVHKNTPIHKVESKFLILYSNPHHLRKSKTPSRSSFNRKSIDNEDRKRKHSKSSSVSSGNSNSNSNSKGHGHGKKKERSNPPKEDRARGRESSSSTERSNSQTSTRNSDRSNWAAGEELPTNVLEAEDLITHQNQGNRQPLSDSPSPPHTPPRLDLKEKSC
ncbi:hypothetical protein H4I95_00524 [Botrytis cinerea]